MGPTVNAFWNPPNPGDALKALMPESKPLAIPFPSAVVWVTECVQFKLGHPPLVQSNTTVSPKMTLVVAGFWVALVLSVTVPTAPSGGGLRLEL